MLIKGRLEIIYKRGIYATVYDVKHSAWHVVDTTVRCPKSRMWSVGEFPSEGEATQYCKHLWIGDAHLHPTEVQDE